MLGRKKTVLSFDKAEPLSQKGSLLSKVSKTIDNAHLGLYCDDGLALITNCNGQKLDQIRKKLHQTFKEERLKISVSDKSHRPYKKPNNAALYVNKMSNHPKRIINNIPDMVSKRLRNLSSDKRSFLDAKQVYESALKQWFQ